MSDPFQSDKSKLYTEFMQNTSQRVRRDVVETMLAQMSPEQVAAASAELHVRQEAQKAEWEAQRQQRMRQQVEEEKTSLIVAGLGLGVIFVMATTIGIAEYFSKKKQLPQVKPA